MTQITERKNKSKSFLFLAFFILFSIVITPIKSAIAWPEIGINTMEYTDEDDSDCNLSTSLNEAKSDPWWKPPLEAVSDACVTVGNTTFNSVKSGVLKFMVVGFGLWLVLFIMKVVGSLQESDPMENATKIGGMMVKTGFAAYFLNNRDYFFDLVAIITGTAGAYAGLEGSSAGGGLSGVVEPLHALAQRIHDEISRMQGEGDFIKCISEIHRVTIVKDLFDFSDPSAWVSGCCLELAGLILKVVFPFFLFDALIRVGVTAALSPLFIAAWVFPKTNDFAKKGLNSVLNIAFTFLFMKITTDLIISLLKGTSGVGEVKDSPDSKKRLMCELRAWGLGDGDRDSMCSDVEEVSSGFSRLFPFTAAIFYSVLLMKQPGDLANYYSDTSFSGGEAFQAARSAGTAAQTAGKMGIGATKGVANYVSHSKDRSAAKTVENDRRGREQAQKEGRPYRPTEEQTKKVQKAEQRLKRKGFLNANGSENREYADLLKNGNRRTALRAAETVSNFVTGSNSNRYESLNHTYQGNRSASDVQNLKNMNEKVDSNPSGTDGQDYKAERKPTPTPQTKPPVPQTRPSAPQTQTNQLNQANAGFYNSKARNNFIENSMKQNGQTFDKSTFDRLPENERNQMAQNLMKEKGLKEPPNAGFFNSKARDEYLRNNLNQDRQNAGQESSGNKSFSKMTEAEKNAKASEYRARETKAKPASTGTAEPPKS